MMMTARRTVVTLTLLTLVGWAVAQQTDGLRQKRLDAPLTLTVSDKPIGEVFWKLTRASNVRFTVTDETLAALPYAGQTHMDVQLRDVSLRAALRQMLRPHGLDWRIKDGVVQVVPSDALHRMCRRATFDELVLLGRLLTVELSADSQARPVDLLRRASDDDDLALVLPDDLLGEDLAAARRRADQVLPAPAAEWLDLLAGDGRTWYLSGDRITVLNRSDQVRRQLQRRVSLRYQNTRLVNVLLDLARQAQVKLTLAPGSLNILPRDVRNDFTLMIDDATIAQALEVISGATGLEFSVIDDGIDARPALGLKVGEPTAPSDGASAGRDSGRSRAGVIMRTSFIGSDGIERDVLMPIFDLPADMQEAI
ncbi:MAG: STN domain-containing protein [Phycisphaerae bacterium]|nr:STN domain-containing protein [Phycisphaerae bacterium]